MSEIRKVTDDFAVSSQLAPKDLSEFAGRFALVINNRPDGEESGQPCGEEIEAAAREAGLAYVAIPVAGMPGPAEIDAMREAIGDAGGPVLAFCRSGMRCLVTWAAGEAQAGRPLDELRSIGAEAGYDIGPALQRVLG